MNFHVTFNGMDISFHGTVTGSRISGTASMANGPAMNFSGSRPPQSRDEEVQ